METIKDLQELMQDDIVTLMCAWSNGGDSILTAEEHCTLIGFDSIHAVLLILFNLHCFHSTVNSTFCLGCADHTSGDPVVIL